MRDCCLLGDRVKRGNITSNVNAEQSKRDELNELALHLASHILMRVTT